MKLSKLTTIKHLNESHLRNPNHSNITPESFHKKTTNVGEESDIKTMIVLFMSGKKNLHSMIP